MFRVSLSFRLIGNPAEKPSRCRYDHRGPKTLSTGLNDLYQSLDFTAISSTSAIGCLCHRTRANGSSAAAQPSCSDNCKGNVPEHQPDTKHRSDCLESEAWYNDILNYSNDSLTTSHATSRHVKHCTRHNRRRHGHKTALQLSASRKLDPMVY